VKNVLFAVVVTAAFALGFYSLFLASANAGKPRPAVTAGLLRTATAGDVVKIRTALGDMADRDLVYVVLGSTGSGPDPEVETATRRAAGVLANSGVDVSVRLLGPADADFEKIVVQNGASRFPAVLVVKKGGGIVRVTDGLDKKNLIHAFKGTWGRTSSCDEARSEIY